MKTLVVNTYAGSLLLGANQIKGARIIGSYEDVGFGAAITKANRAKFTEVEPDFHFINKYSQWPDQDLTDTVVIAHPPCAAFSQQNTSAAKRGVNTDAFECTRKVLKYAMTNGAAGIAVESVPGALAGAWDVYEHMSQAGGYHVYRIMKNSLLFGVPQFRERFWAVLIRKDRAEPNMTWRLSPMVRTVSSVLDNPICRPGTPVGFNADKFVRRLTTEPCICTVNHAFPEADVRQTGLSHLTGWKRSGFAQRLAPVFFPGEDFKAVCRKHVSPFTSGQPSVLAEGGYAPVLLGSSHWYYRGAPVSQEGYKAIMGFPTDYVFPSGDHYGIRTMLSKGVCPPVATWVLDNVRMHLGEPSGSPFTSGVGYVKVVEPGRIASFRPSRVEILERLEMMYRLGSPENDELFDLRDEEDALEED